MERLESLVDSEESTALRAAWLHYVGGLTQAAVAKRLGLTSLKTHRLIAKAVAEGAVKVSIDGDITQCVSLEHQLVGAYGLDYCQVAPDLGEEGIPLRTLGQAGARFLRQQLSGKHAMTIGISLGRTLSASIAQLPRMEAPNVRFVSLLGGLTRDFAVNRYDVLHWIAEKTGAPSYTMPVPLLANSVEDREVLLAQRGVKEIFTMAEHADLKLLGIGTVDSAAQLVASGTIKPEEIGEIAAAGGIGEASGHFFDANGNILKTSLAARTLSTSFMKERIGQVVAVAGGATKVSAIRAVLKSGVLTGLITDECTAVALLQ
ncbi:sugar-binding transcriptional regulator [Hahella sp. CCB-MM4]|uniref:sugar-binding transcriptional regulator n=1 Tax=Hahella sp. (strain CCB-MM4) TaxID=1926491 RepID=UPI001AEFAB55|nr:sugar-binding transcriptional regulator [Hahella sp. CCB-MM4]